MNRTEAVRARRAGADVRDFRGPVVPQSQISKVRDQGFSLPIVPDFGSQAEPQLGTAALTESVTAGLAGARSPEGAK